MSFSKNKIANKIANTIEIDDILVEVSMDETYLDVARRLDINIPTLCYHPELIPLGSCRLCIVEVDNRLVPSCSTKVEFGKKVITDNYRIRKHRRLILELIIADHPMNCIVCHKQGNCIIQDLAFEYVPMEKLHEFEPNAPRENLLLEINEFFKVDHTLCIKCGMCVQVVDEIQLCGVLSMVGRGAEMFPGTGFNQSFDEAGCVSCGNCVSVCPVAAMMPITLVNSNSGEKNCERIVSTCTYCGVGCQFELVVNPKMNEIIYVDSYLDAPVNGISLCVKGNYGWDFVHHEDRLNTPLIKKNGVFEEATWDEALDLIEEKLKAYKEEFGSGSLAFLTSAKCTNEENYLMQKLSRAALKTNNIDHCARLCHASTVAGLARAFGSGAMTNSINDLTNDAEVVFIIGSNTTEAHPVIGIKLKQAVAAGKTKLIVADPREIELASLAEIHLRHLPGSDVALINAFLKIIIDEGLADEEFISSRTEGFAEVKEVIDSYLLEDLCKIANVSVEKTKEAARMFAKAKTAAIVYSMGITQHTTGTDNVFSLANLAMVTGHIGKPGTGVNPLRGQNNVQGACDMGGLPDVYPGYQKVHFPEMKDKFEKAWGVTDLDAEPGLTITEMMNKAHDGEVKSIWIMGENPVLSDPNITHVREALEKLPFLIVQDIFMTETAKYADVVLPGVSFAEKDGTFTNTERRVQLVRKAIEPTGERRQDWWILQEMIKRFGIDITYSSPSEIMDELAKITPIYGGINFERIDPIGLQWPCPDTDHPGTKVLHQEKFSRGLGKFHAVKYLDPAEMPDEEYPLILTTGRILYHFHTGEMTRRSKGINIKRPIERSQINPIDAERLGIKDGEKMVISSRRGSLETVAKVTEKIQPGVVFMSFHFKESAANLLTNDAVDPIAKIPEFKVCAIKVKKA